MAHFQKDGLWIQGGGGALAYVDEATPFVPGQLGKVMSIKDTNKKDVNFYQYVRRYTTDAVTIAAGYPAYWQDLDDFVVTADSSLAFGGTTNPVMAGVFLGTAPTTAYYGFIQVGGLAAVSVTDTGVLGDRLQLTATDTQLKQLAAITITSQAVSVAVPAPVYGIAYEAFSESTNSNVSVLLQCIHNGW